MDGKTTGGALRLDGYVRVSKVGGREGEGFISPDVQADAMKQWAAGRGYELLVHPAELDVSGGTMSRPVFDSILVRIHDGQSDGLLVYKVDRFARSLLGGMLVLEEIAQANGTFASVLDQVDLTTPQGRAFLQMQLVFAELFREQIREGFDTAVKRAVENGIHMGNQPNFGYDRVDRRLVPNDDAPAVHEIFERRSEGEGASSIARWLDDASPRADGGNWTPAHVRSILSREAYMGIAHYGKHRNTKAHTAIVMPELWHRAQQATVVSRPRSEASTLLAGLVRCAGCRYSMTPSKSGRADAKVPTYRCRGRHTAGECKAPATVNRARLDAHVEVVFRERYAGIRAHAVAESLDLGEVDERIENLRVDLESFVVDDDSRRILGARYHALLERKVTVLDEAERERAETIAAASVPAVELEGWDDFSTDEKRSVLTQAITAVLVRKAGSSRQPIEDRVVVLWRGEGEHDFPRRGRVNGAVTPFVWPADANS